MLSNSTNKINNLHRIGIIVLKYVNGEVQKTLFDGKNTIKKPLILYSYFAVKPEVQHSPVAVMAVLFAALSTV